MFSLVGIGNPYVFILAAIVVGTICSALGYVSSFLGTCVTFGLIAQQAGPVTVINYPEAEAYAEAQTRSADAPVLPGSEL